MARTRLWSLPRRGRYPPSLSPVRTRRLRDPRTNPNPRRSRRSLRVSPGLVDQSRKNLPDPPTPLLMGKPKRSLQQSTCLIYFTCRFLLVSKGNQTYIPVSTSPTTCCQGAERSNRISRCEPSRLCGKHLLSELPSWQECPRRRWRDGVTSRDHLWSLV